MVNVPWQILTRSEGPSFALAAGGWPCGRGARPIGVGGWLAGDVGWPIGAGQQTSSPADWVFAAVASASSGAEMLLAGPWGYVVFGLLGAVVGSFLNVVIVRLPSGLSVVRPASHCPSCKKPICWYDNIPLLSYLVLRGRCRSCGTAFSVLYFLVELASAALAVAVYHHTMPARAADPWIGLAHFVAEFSFVSVMLVVAFIDLRTWIIPNIITYPAAAVFLGTGVVLGRLPWWEALAGACAGFGVVAAVIWGYHRLTGREGMGWGDAKLLAAVGAFLGWRHLPAVLFLAAVQGLIAAIVCVLLGRSMEPTHTYAGLTDEEGEEEDVKGEEKEGRDDRGEEGRHEDGAGRVWGGGDEDEDEGEGEKAKGRGGEGRVGGRGHGAGKREGDGKGDGECKGDGPDRSPSIRHVPVPFGPFLALAAVQVLFFGHLIANLWTSD